MIELDAIDRAILSQLQKDARLPNVVLADRVGLSPSACSRRVDALEKSGVVRGYHARLSSRALGHPIVVIVYITLEGQSVDHLTAFENAVRECPNVLVCYLMSGTSDYLLRVAARDLADYERIHKEWLSAMPGVARMTSSFALREVINRASVDMRINDRVPSRSA
ncbi:MAG: Lrp/AsnC family transcriptional regulator [Rhizobiaceae bacterium]